MNGDRNDFGGTWCSDNDGQYPHPANLEETLLTEPNTLERLRELADGFTGPYGSRVEWESHFDDASRELVEGHGYEYGRGME